MRWRKGHPVPEFVKTYRGIRILRTCAQRPGEPDWDIVYIVRDWTGIWFTMKAIEDYIDWRLSR